MRIVSHVGAVWTLYFTETARWGLRAKPETAVLVIKIILGLGISQWWKTCGVYTRSSSALVEKKNGKAKSGNQTNTHTVIKECRVNG